MVAFNNPNEELEAQLETKTRELFDFCQENNIPLLVHSELGNSMFTSLYTPKDEPVSKAMLTLIMHLQLMGLDV